MVYRISAEVDYLRADLFNRETTAESQEFFGRVVDSAKRLRRSQVLISVHTSTPVFTAERSGFLVQLMSMGAREEHKIALVADSEELNHSHEYLELVGRQHGINVRHFRDEPSALAWLKGAP
ncbi:MAG TPA: hypothetical protein VMU67_05175 [Steroidobacteraceae bacterium]|nr:hypothetical protein [Steroidobacteraceae bacterium]